MSYGYPTQNHQNGSRQPEYREGSLHPAQGGGRQNERASNYMHRTTTVVEQQIRNRLPTLVLQLQQRAPSHRNNGRSQSYHNHDKLSNLSDRELDEYVASNLQDFKRELMNNIDSFHQTVLSARPNPATEREDPEGYRIHREQYQEFLKLANELMNRMQESFNDILTRYREYIDQLWTAICQGQDVRHLQRQFEQHMQQNMARYWTPIFDRADQLINEIDLNFNQHSSNPKPGYEPRSKH